MHPMGGKQSKMNSAVLSSQQTITSSKFSFLELWLTLSIDQCPLYTFTNLPSLIETFCIMDVSTVYLPPLPSRGMHLNERVLFVVIQISERSKGCDCYRLAHENLGTARSSFSCWITLNYLSSDTSNFGQISNVVAREESSGFQFAWCVVGKLWDRNLLVKIGSELDRSSTRGRRVFLPCLSTICSGKRRMQSASNYFQLQEWQYTTFQIKGRLF